MVGYTKHGNQSSHTQSFSVFIGISLIWSVNARLDLRLRCFRKHAECYAVVVKISLAEQSEAWKIHDRSVDVRALQISQRTYKK